MTDRDQAVPVGGWHAVIAAMRSGRRVFELWLLQDRDDARAREAGELAADLGVACRQMTRAELDARLPGINHQGCVALCAPLAALGEAGLDDILSAVASPLLLVLDGVQDPHNLGACLRSAAAAGADAVITPRDRAAGLSTVVRKTAAGGADCVPLVQVTNLARTLRNLQAAGVWVVGTAAEAPRSIHETPLTGPLALVLGGEGGGLRHLTARTCDHLAAIPMAGGVASLNVSVAAGICLFEALRQRGASGTV